MRILELFSGTGSVGNVCRRLGCTVTSLDRDLPADLQMDILDWDYTSLPPRSFDFIWASPPCTEYSVAKTVGVRKLEEANAIVQRTLEIINYFDPPYWIIENPQTGLLKNQPFMTNLPMMTWITVNTECPTANALDSGTTSPTGSPSLYVRRIVAT